MALEFNSSGLSIQTLQEIINEYSDELKSVYGDNIDLSQNTPDGQRVSIESKARQDLQQGLLSLKNNIDPELSQGAFLDVIIKFAGLTRKAATRSTVDVDITTDRPLTLKDDYTLIDDVGQNWVVTNGISLSTGTTSVKFEASEFGNINAASGTITEQDTIVIGVSGVNNPSAAVAGDDEETDKELRLRRKESFENPAFSTSGSLLSKLFNLDNVTDVKVYENDSDTTDSTKNIAPHTIWAIVENGSNADIFEAIAKEKTGGTGLKGSVTGTFDETITVGSKEITFTHNVKFDRPSTKDLYINVTATRKNSSDPVDKALIKDELAKKSYSIAEEAFATELYDFGYNAGTNFFLTDLEISDDNITFTDDDLNPGFDGKFTIDTANITVNEVVP